MRRPEAIVLIVMGLFVSATPALPDPAVKIERMSTWADESWTAVFMVRARPRLCWSAASRLPNPIGTP
jgi:hypothetical protein